MKEPSAMLGRVAACDLGKATAKLVTASLQGDGPPRIDAREVLAHGGSPLEAFIEWYRRENVASCLALGVTGLHGLEVQPPAVSGLPGEACIEAALGLTPQEPLNLISIGASGCAAIGRDAHGRIRHVESDKCSSGTGETILKIAHRFGLSIEEADRIACSAARAIPITARCSVFAKSEMTHFGNQGEPADALFKGYFAALASHAAALLARVRVPGPVRVIGGGSRLTAMLHALAACLEQEVSAAEHARFWEATGALVLACEQARARRLPALPDDPTRLLKPRERRFRVLTAASRAASRVRRVDPPVLSAAAAREPSVLGIDLGSTGSKAALVSVATGDMVLDAYDRTRGNPVEAAARLIGTLIEQNVPDVRAIALTGSGREAAATVVRAAYPELGDRLVVQNEIVAHATAAIRCDEDGGRSLSVVEIGGQDAKYIEIAAGRIVQSDMNRACSAGTGSFLEEQGAIYGMEDITEFTTIAQGAERPPDLGQMCTVFVADAAAEALSEGFALPDVLGGFQYAVIHNYLNRVMGQRTFGERIFFQGKPAEGPSLAWTLAAVTGRDVVVPPNPGAMGAWGIGLLAREEIGTQRLREAGRIDLGVYLGAEVAERSEFQCRDKSCATLCHIEKTTVSVNGTPTTVLSGGACPKYEIPGSRRSRLEKEAPSAIEELQALLAPFLAPSPGTRTVGVALVGACHSYLPWLVTFVQGLGLGTRVLRSAAGSLMRGEGMCRSYDACAPVKIAHGVLDADVDLVFLPKILEMEDGHGGGKTCPMQRALPEMVRDALAAGGRTTSVVHPIVVPTQPASGELRARLRRAARQLGADPSRVDEALQTAIRVQAQYERDREAIGRRTLDYASKHGRAVVALCGSTHVIHDRAINADIPRLLREEGALALPMDAFPLGPDVLPMPTVPWADARRALSVAAAARTRGGVYPLLLSAFGCGPASFVEQLFSALMEGYPHTTLESDGHGGKAGYVTRVQAFLHAVRQHDGAPSPVPEARRRLFLPLERRPIEKERKSRIVYYSMGDRIPALLAATYRSMGFDATHAGPSSAEVLALGRRDCSGKECLPYQLMWGAFRQHLEREPPDRRTLIVQVRGDGMCRNCAFFMKDVLSLERLGLGENVAVRQGGPDSSGRWAFLFRVFSALVTWDLLVQLAGYYRVSDPKAADGAYERYWDELVSLLGRPQLDSAGGIGEIWQRVRELRDILDRAAREFAAIARRSGDDEDLRTVLVSGDIYVRFDDFANDRLQHRLSERGLRVLVEPISVICEYMSWERLGELIGLPASWPENAIIRNVLVWIRRVLYRGVRRVHPWLPDWDVRPMIARSRERLDKYPQGEAPVTIGSVLHHWRQGICDGVVVPSPWGCGPALVGESLLRHHEDIPMLFLYFDGAPVDERRLNAFAHRLRSRARRAG